MIEPIQIKISEVELLLDEYDIEVESPDGWVPISSFVNKGLFDEYILTLEDGHIVRCNENHLFETQLGWASAKECLLFGRIKYLCKNGFTYGVVTKTDNIIPIVDIQVDHENHRYYTESVSSHNTGGGKSAVKCSLAADYLSQGYNVLYITLELAEERIAERIDANLFNVPIQEMKNLSERVFIDKVSKIKEKTHGKLVIKEYPTASALVANFRILLDELKNKRGFVPDVMIVDYLGICTSAKYKSNGNVNTYTIQKSVAEELRGFAVEQDLLCLTSVQTNRTGFNNSDFDIDSISDSSGIIMTADLMFGIIRTDDLTALNQIILKQLKNRFGDPNYYKKFVVGMDFSRMKMYNVENSGQTTEIQSTIKNEESESRYGTKTATNRSSSSSGWDFDD